MDDLSTLPPLLTVGQVAQIMQLRPSTIRALLAEGRLPGVRTGGDRGDWRVPRSAIERLIGAAEAAETAAR